MNIDGEETLEIASVISSIMAAARATGTIWRAERCWKCLETVAIQCPVLTLSSLFKNFGIGMGSDTLKISALHRDDPSLKILDLVINITKHELKPKHLVLTDEEKESLLKKYSIEEKQLPRMSQNDAIARYYGLEKGQVVKVTYNGELTQLHVTYRCVW